MNLMSSFSKFLEKAGDFYTQFRLVILITLLVLVLGGGAALTWRILDGRKEARLSAQVNRLSIELYTVGQQAGVSLEAQDRIAAIYTELESIGKKETGSLNGGRALYLAAHGDMQRNQWAAARDKYDLLVKKNGSHYLAPQALFHSAVTFEEEGQMDKSMERLLQFERNYPGHYLLGEVRLTMARQHAAAGKMDQAKVLWEKILGDKSMNAYHGRAAQELRLAKLRSPAPAAKAAPAPGGAPLLLPR